MFANKVDTPNALNISSTTNKTLHLANSPKFRVHYHMIASSKLLNEKAENDDQVSTTEPNVSRIKATSGNLSTA